METPSTRVYSRFGNPLKKDHHYLKTPALVSRLLLLNEKNGFLRGCSKTIRRPT